MPFTNGTFETGDVTGWDRSDAGSVGDFEATANVQTYAKRTGTYGMELILQTMDDESTAQISVEQTVTLADFSTIDVWFKMHTLDIAGYGQFQVYMSFHTSGETEAFVVCRYTYNLTKGIPPNGWLKFVVNKAEFLAAVSYLGGHVHTTSKFRMVAYLVSETSGTKTANIYIDDIVMDKAAAGELTNGNFASGMTGWFDCSDTDCIYPPSDAVTNVGASGTAQLVAAGNFYDYAVASIAQEMTTDFVSVTFGWTLEDTELDLWCLMLVQFLVYTDTGLPVWETVVFTSIAPGSDTMVVPKTELEVSMGYDSLVFGTSTAIRISLYLRPVS